MELLDFQDWYSRESETQAEDQYLIAGAVAEINNKREQVGEDRSKEALANNLNGNLAKLLNKLDLGLNSVVSGKLGHLSDLDPFKEHVRAGMLFAATYMKKYLELMQPGLLKDMEEYEAQAKRMGRRNKLKQGFAATKKKSGEQMLQTFNAILRTQGTKGSQGSRGTKSKYRLYEGPLHKVDDVAGLRSGLGLCSRYAHELVMCSMKCPAVHSDSDKAGRRHRKRVNMGLKRDLDKAIEQRFATNRRMKMEKDDYKLVQQIDYHYRSLYDFVKIQKPLCNTYFQSQGWHLDVEAAVKRNLELQINSIVLEPLAYSLKDTMNALRYFSVLTREINPGFQVATNGDYVGAVLDCMKSSFMYDPFDVRFGKMVAGEREEKKEFVDKLVGTWRQDEDEEQEQEQQQDNI